MQELRDANVESIRAVRRRHKQKWSDAGGYDLIKLPMVRFGCCCCTPVVTVYANLGFCTLASYHRDVQSDRSLAIS